MYQLGVISKNAGRFTYKEIRQRLAQLRRLEKAIEVISSKGYRDLSELQKEIRDGEMAAGQIKCQLNQLRKEKRPYEQMLDLYQEAERMEGAYLLYKEGNEEFKEEAAVYQELKRKTDAIPHTKEELETYKMQHGAEERKLKRALKEEQDRLKLFRELEQDYSRVMKEYQPADELMIRKMEEAGIKNRERNRKR